MTHARAPWGDGREVADVELLALLEHALGHGLGLDPLAGHAQLRVDLEQRLRHAGGRVRHAMLVKYVISEAWWTRTVSSLAMRSICSTLLVRMAATTGCVRDGTAVWWGLRREGEEYEHAAGEVSCGLPEGDAPLASLVTPPALDEGESA